MALAAFTVAVLALGATASDVCSGGLSGSTYVMGRSCYEFVAKEKTWISAQSHCRSRGGRLAAVTSADIQKWISSKASTLFQGYQGVWIGLNDRAKERSFVWDNYNGMPDAASGYTNWNSGQPDNFFFNQDCVYMRQSYNWRWDDLECNLPFRWYNFICEYRVVPSTVPTTVSWTTTLASSSSASLVTTAVPSAGNTMSDNNVTAVTALITGMPSLTASDTFKTVASEQPSSTVRATWEVDAMTLKMATTEPTTPASSSADLGMSSLTSNRPINTMLISSSISNDSRLLSNASTTESETSYRSTETTVSIHHQSINSSERAGTTEPSHSTVDKKTNDFEADTTDDETYLASRLKTNAASTQSEASTPPPETPVSIHRQSPNSSERTRSGEPGARHVALQESTHSPDMPIYLSVIAIILLGAVAAFAALGYKIHKRRQQQQRRSVGIENPLY